VRARPSLDQAAPEWFTFRPDGSIKYAENPPKKYQDIVNVNFQRPHREALWNALRDVVLFWVEQRGQTFRVDNPHTKPVPFWEWLIREVQDAHPDVIFLAEAFTRPKMMKALAKLGSRSRTLLHLAQLQAGADDYLTELTRTEAREYFRPNFFANTPDILPPILQKGGRPRSRSACRSPRRSPASTASTTATSCARRPRCRARRSTPTPRNTNTRSGTGTGRATSRPSSPRSIASAATTRRCTTPQPDASGAPDDDNVIFYGKMTADRSNMVFVAVNLDPLRRTRPLWFPIGEIGLAIPTPSRPRSC
jgi:starch synthase (maltosyl-transferring)